MKRIPLTRGQFALVDDEDFDGLMEYKWHVTPRRNGSYAAVRAKSCKLIYMARQIMDAPAGKVVDHKNHNTLDNRRTNLRICTRSQNHMNELPHREGSSKYKGVSWNKACNKWKAFISKEGYIGRLGGFTCEVEAAKAYDEAAKELFGEFAYLNFP